MIDLHMHTKHSDGDHELSDVLRMCEAENLTAISITDHDTVEAYTELENPATRSLFSGHIIPGVEISALCHNIPIEILGYGVDPLKIAKHIRPLPVAKKK